MQDSDLDDLFATARQQRHAVPADLMTRVLADADALQPGFAAPRIAAPPPRQGFLAGLLAAIGGAGGLAGLSTAALAGVWIGFAQPAALSPVTDAFLAMDTVAETLDALPAFDDFLSEG